jgi:hypothetical protein
MKSVDFLFCYFIIFHFLAIRFGLDFTYSDIETQSEKRVKPRESENLMKRSKLFIVIVWPSTGNMNRIVSDGQGWT